MSPAVATTVAVTFTWIGLVGGISFIEAPLKFRAPGVTVAIGLGIGRLVFRAVNTVEVVLGVAVVLALVVDTPGPLASTALLSAVVVLAVQLLSVRPRLARRSDAILAGQEAPRSGAHHVFVALESAKVVLLLVGGVASLAGG